MKNMLSYLSMPLLGHHHSGLDDSRNIAAICGRLAREGCVFKVSDLLNRVVSPLHL